MAVAGIPVLASCSHNSNELTAEKKGHPCTNKTLPPLHRTYSLGLGGSQASNRFEFLPPWEHLLKWLVDEGQAASKVQWLAKLNVTKSFPFCYLPVEKEKVSTFHSGSSFLLGP